jgi:tetratricopeptide (TPR) repeat protein
MKWLGWSIVACLGISVVVVAADESRPPMPPEASRPLTERLPVQPGDAEVEPFTPRVPPTEEDRARTEALSWYMTGQLAEGRNDHEAAQKAYRKAVELAPREIKPYQSLVTIAFARGERAEATRFALAAARIRREGLPLARGLAALLVRASETGEAIKVLQEILAALPSDVRPVDELLVHRELGMYHRLIGGTQTAVTHYRKVYEALTAESSQLTPQDRDELLGDAGETYEEMGTVFLDAKLADLAVAAFNEAARFNKSTPGIHSFNLATVYKETGRPEDALQELQKYFDAQLQTKGRAAYKLLKDLLAELEQSEKLLPRLEELLDKDRRNVTLSYFLAEQYADQDHLDEAEELLEETLGNSNDPRGLVGLAGVYLKRGRAKPLLESLKKAFQVVPQTDDAQVLERMDSDTRAVVEHFAELQAQVAKDEPMLEKLMALGRELNQGDEPKIEFLDAYLIGKLAADGENFDGAKEFYQLAIDMQNDPPAQLFRELGFALIDGERFQEAAAVIQQALDHPSSRLQADGVRSFFLYLHSHALEMDGQTDAALAAIRKARESQPDNAGLHFQEAWVLYHAQRWPEAIREFESIIARYGSQDDEESRRVVRNSRFSLSAVFVQLEEYQRGEDVLQEVYRQEPDHPQVNNDLGYLWAERGKNLDQAREMITKALAAEPENPAYLDSMGWVLYQLGKYDESRDFLEKATALPRGEDATIFDHLGDAYEKLGRHDDAVKAWTRAAEIEQEKKLPDEKILRRVRSKLPDGADEGPQSTSGQSPEPRP